MNAAHHRNVVRVIDSETTGEGTQFLVMRRAVLHGDLKNGAAFRIGIARHGCCNDHPRGEAP